MALLTTEDVLNKKFTPTKFREGYDLDEVDDFLDEIVDTIGALQSENQELKDKLAAAERRIAELSEGAAASEAKSAAEAPKPAADGIPAEEPESATSMLALAQRLHDEYVRDGREEGDRIIADARIEGEAIVRGAQEQHSRVLAQLEQERTLLEKKIDELKAFERDYRGQIRSHLETLISSVKADAVN